MPTNQLLIAGASVRAQVASAIRAGFSVEAFDLFADHDCQAACNRASHVNASITRIESMEAIVDQIAIRSKDPTKPVPDIAILCGGFERHQAAVNAINDRLPIAGCCPETVARLADQNQIRNAIEAADCLFAPTSTKLPANANPSNWIRKPILGSGGFDSRLARESDFDTLAVATDHLFQNRIEGESWSALFIANEGRSSAGEHRLGFHPPIALTGVTRQLVGDDRLTDSPFAYCGSIGPLRLPSHDEHRLQKLGLQLATQFGLKGVFGVDFILNSQGIWPVDINPRITASAEIFERFDRETDQPRAFNMIKAQLGQVDLSDHSIHCVQPTDQLCGKAIVFNQTDRFLRTSNETVSQLAALAQADIQVADIPNEGITIAPGDPITTILTTASDATAVESNLVSAAASVRRCFAGDRVLTQD